MRLLDNIPWLPLLLLAVLLGLAPFSPKPHLVEKVHMLFSGTLTRPVDVFDLFTHGFPLLLVVAKGLLSVTRRTA